MYDRLCHIIWLFSKRTFVDLSHALLGYTKWVRSEVCFIEVNLKWYSLLLWAMSPPWQFNNSMLTLDTTNDFWPLEYDKYPRLCFIFKTGAILYFLMYPIYSNFTL